MKLLEVMQAKFACQFTDSLSQLFDGFQTSTSTLGKDVFITDHLATPCVEIMMENETAGTSENEVKPVNEKMHREANNEDEAIEHYTFGLETAVLKDHRTSLRELFQKTRTSMEKAEPLTKKIQKRRTIQSSSKHCTVAPVGSIKSDSANEKLHKILRMLHRVHPETLAISQKSQNLWKYVMKSNCTDDGYYENRNQMLSEDIIIFPYTAISEKSENHAKSNMSDHIAYDTNWRREFWIKSDAEYLILEL